MTRASIPVLLILTLACVGCASTGAPKRSDEAVAAPAPESVRPEPPESSPPAEAPMPAPAPEPEPEETGAYGPKTVVIGETAPEEPERASLLEAARTAREQRAAEDRAPVAVITDETLPEYATGELTIAAESEAEKSVAATPGTADASTEAADERGEEYWRTRVREARIRWRDLVEEVAQLETTAAELRQRFYAEDDGFYRDSQIKPAWDRALDRLAETEDEVGRAQQELQAVLLEGRTAGALPGWLREGIEYEPELVEPDTEPGIHEATEPKVIEVEEEGNGR